MSKNQKAKEKIADCCARCRSILQHIENLDCTRRWKIDELPFEWRQRRILRNSRQRVLHQTDANFALCRLLFSTQNYSYTAANSMR